LPYFVVRKFVYQIISITGKEMCPPNCYTAEYIRGILSLLATSKSSTEVYQYFRMMFVLTFTSHSVQSSINKKQTRNTDNPLHFLKLAVTVRCNFKGIFSSSNCPDQHQGPPSLHWS
jgi:hypothetical protein